jgi:hypothetical protein
MGQRFPAQIHKYDQPLGSYHEMPRPLLLEGFRYACPSLSQCRTHPLQCSQRIVVDPFRSDNHDSPAILIKPFPTFEIMDPLLAIERVLTSVVLDDQLVLGITEVEAPAPLTPGRSNNEVHVRFGKPSEDDEQAYPGLHCRVNASTYERCGSAGPSGITALIGSRSRHKLLWVKIIRFDQTVACDHQVNKGHRNARQIQKALNWARNRYPVVDRRLRRGSSKVCSDAGSATSNFPGRHAHVDVG